jgi:hypothetical protein
MSELSIVHVFILIGFGVLFLLIGFYTKWERITSKWETSVMYGSIN